MLIKDIYTLPDDVHGILQSPNGFLYRFILSPFRRLSGADLEPITSPCPSDVYLAAAHAKPFTSPFRAEMMRNYGLTDIPLRHYREVAGLTQRQLADASGVNVRQIQRVEGGTSTAGNLTATNLLAIAAALGIDPHLLIL